MVDFTLLSHFVCYQYRKMSWSGGDWICSACQHSNFKKRDTCHRCGYPKYGGPDPSTYMSNRTEVLAGDWYCNCGAHNYASRSNCFKCSAYKNDYAMMGSGGYGSDCSAPPGWKSGDWICSRWFHIHYLIMLLFYYIITKCVFRLKLKL